MESQNFPVGPSNHGGQSGVPAPANPTTRAVAFPPAPPAILTGSPNVWSLLAALRRRWQLAVGLGLVGGTVAAVVAWYWSVAYTYTAVSVIHVDPQPSNILAPARDGRDDLMNFQHSQVALIK